VERQAVPEAPESRFTAERPTNRKRRSHHDNKPERHRAVREESGNRNLGIYRSGFG